MNMLLLGHLVVTCLMIGIIWMVQWVHYPLMAHTGHESSAMYQRLHSHWMSGLVVPLMITELMFAAALCLNPETASAVWAWVGFGLLIAIWVVTFAASVPAHQVLRDGFNTRAHEKLMASNTVRTFLWSGRGVIAALLLVA